MAQWRQAQGSFDSSGQSSLPFAKFGGSAQPSDVVDRAIEMLEIGDDERAERTKGGTLRVLNQAHWARRYLGLGRPDRRQPAADGGRLRSPAGTSRWMNRTMRARTNSSSVSGRSTAKSGAQPMRRASQRTLGSKARTTTWTVLPPTPRQHWSMRC